MSADVMDKKERVMKILEAELGAWLDRNVNLILRSFGAGTKIFPLLCGSLVEGFAVEGSDVDFILLIDDMQKSVIRGVIRDKFRTFIEDIESSNVIKDELGLDHFCPFSRGIKTTKWLFEFRRARDPSFRTNYFLFSDLLHPDSRNMEIRRMLATEEDLVNLKRKLLKRFRGKYGYQIPIKLKEQDKRCLSNPKNCGSKGVYRRIQLAINSLIAAYGLSMRKLDAITEDFLKNKFKRIVRSVLPRNATERLFNEVRPEELFNKLLMLKRRKVRSLSKAVRDGLISNDELRRLTILTNFLLKFVYRPLELFYEPHIKVVEASMQLGWRISYVGLRVDHAYVALREHPIINCIDIIPSGDTELYDVYVVVKRDYQRIFKEKFGKNEILVEKVREHEVCGSFKLPIKTHVLRKKGRLHFKVMSVSKNISVDDLARRLSELSQIIM